MHTPRSCCRSTRSPPSRDTFNEWVDVFITEVDKDRDSLSMPNARAALLLDHASQHMSDDTKAKFAAANVGVHYIPRSQTHVYQPADAFVIAGVKRGVSREWETELSSTFARLGVTDAVEACTRMTAAARRALLYKCMAKALDGLGTGVLETSWAKSGALRAMFTEVPLVAPFYDAYRDMSADEANAAGLAGDAGADIIDLRGDEDDADEDGGLRGDGDDAHEGAADEDGEDGADDDVSIIAPGWYAHPPVLKGKRGRPSRASRGVTAADAIADHRAAMKRKRASSEGIAAFARKAKRARLLGID
eukprot:TRINITY_DN9454_c0_g2_i1.p1 TRINITY_DN9454_c0_g2~~TRINITY_DN9454_c0_g2_i1.p1  ORF type:complete len:305 (-),score=69.90 TRINITY_DN9454_c0_g2_i1:574-1488(-)